MFGRVPPTLVQGELGRQQASQCGFAQSAQPTGRAPLGHEIRREPVAGFPGSDSSRGSKVTDVRALHLIPIGHECVRTKLWHDASHASRTVSHGICSGPIARGLWRQFCSVPAAVFDTRTKFRLPWNRSARTGQTMNMRNCIIIKKISINLRKNFDL